MESTKIGGIDAKLASRNRVFATVVPPQKPQGLGRIGITGDVAQKWEGLRDGLEAKADDNEILIYGPIVDTIDAGWMTEIFGEDVAVSAKIFKQKLDAISGDVLVRINSPGGDVWEASGIITAITERQKKGDKVNMVVDGLAASAASMVMVVGDAIEIAKLANIMIHECSALMYGNKRDFSEVAAFLESKDEDAVGLYKMRMADKTEEEIMELLEAETWFSPDEAVSAGLADSVVEVSKKAKADNKDDDKKVDGKALFARRELKLAALSSSAAA